MSITILEALRTAEYNLRENLENDPKEHLEKELIQVAAVAVAWIERIDKKELEEIICIATH